MLTITGTVTRGKGIARHAMKKKITAGVYRTFAFKPYPGTLNLNVSKNDIQRIQQQPSITDKHNRVYYPARMNGLPCYVVVWDTHIEIIAARQLRSAYRLSEGSPVTLVF